VPETDPVVGRSVKKSAVWAPPIVTLIAALADNAMGLSCVQVLTAAGRKPEGGLVTVSMAIDFIGAAKLGQWVAFDTQYVKTGRSLCFAQAFVTGDGDVIARADARFRVL
jgi:acyl-coenzyme A thioesterase PaaI-like protein